MFNVYLRIENGTMAIELTDVNASEVETVTQENIVTDSVTIFWD